MMENMRGVFVEFIPKAPADVSDKDEFLSVKCESIDQALQIERLFHAAGWVARALTIESVRRFPADWSRTRGRNDD